jgi:hypothetical protein
VGIFLRDGQIALGREAKAEAGRFALDQGQADSRKRPEQMVYPRNLLVMFMKFLHSAILSS